ncbi:hypothetical protein GOV13_03510, partial [Candidatus Pacearchaeota archaeon]|nr:hypothetical protein [Candidatus Pacearchaeota archaeon]
GKTIILITHDLELIKYAGRVIHIMDGKVEKDTGVKSSKNKISNSIENNRISKNIQRKNERRFKK